MILDSYVESNLRSFQIEFSKLTVITLIRGMCFDFDEYDSQSSVEKQLEYWINHCGCNPFPRNIYLEKAGFSIYIRSSERYFENKLLHTFDIGRIEIPEERRGEGWFSNFLRLIESYGVFEALFIESVQNQRLVKKLLREGWIWYSIWGHLSNPPSFIKLTQE